MSHPFLRMKLCIPQPRARMVPRPDLIARLDSGLDRCLTLVSAPAGFGKTTLVSIWARSCERRVLWITLDEDDNDPASFVSYLVAALQQIDPSIGANHHNNPHASLDAMIIDLLNDLAASPTPVVLVLDEYEHIQNLDIHRAFSLFIGHLPAHIHVVIITRRDPPLPLPRLRGRREENELRATDLAFTREEIRHFVESAIAREPQPEMLALLENWTEGWITGLQMAVLSMQGSADPLAVVQAFTGADHFVVDYFGDEVLSRQPEDVQRFLLYTSLLGRFTADLCDALLEDDAELAGRSSEILDYLEHSNLFLVSLDSHREWFRYYNLFADLLQQRLKRLHPDQVASLHRRAGEWFQSRGFSASAVHHALAAGDADRAAQIVEGSIFPMLVQARPSAIAREIDSLPDSIIRLHPWLHIASAWARAYAGQYVEADQMLIGIEQSLAANAAGLSPDEIKRITGYLATVRAHVLSALGADQQATEYALRALDCLPEDSLTMRSLATTMASTGLVSSGDLDRAVNTLKKAAAMGYKARNTHATMIALCDAAQLQIAQARLHPAAQTCKDAFHYAEEHIHHTSRQVLLSGYASTIYSTILYQWNDLDQALYHAERGIELSEQWQAALVVCHGYVALTRVNRARGDYVRALAAIQSAEHFLAENHISELPCLDQLIAEKNRLALLMGDRPAVYRYIQECQLAPGSDITTANHTGCLTLARTMLACRHHDDALALLTDCASFAVRQGRIFNLIEARILQALTHQSKGADSRALVMLEEALELAYPEQLIRVFLDEGEAMSCLLYKAAAHSLYPDYTGRLLALFPAGGKPARYESDDSVYIEPLSDRELEVLCLIAEGRSNSEAADQLVVSLNTVKKHATNIFNKLGVTSRTQAVARARSLGILPGNGSGHST